MAFDLTAHLIDTCRERFLKDGNPLHVWAAYRLARRKVVPRPGPSGFSPLNVAPPARPLEPLPLPNWITEYLDLCADQLLDGDDPKEALLMWVPSGHGHHSQLMNLERDENMTAFIDTLLSLEPADAIEAVKSMQLDREEVEDFIAVFEQGRPTADHICVIVAAITERPGNPFSSKALSYEMVRSTYYRLKDNV